MFGAILGAAAGIGSAILSNRQSKKNAQASFDRETAWNREMMQNAHQWQVEDLRKAGLNPILSANGAQSLGASSTPAQVITPDLETAVQGFNAKTMRKTQEMNYEKLREEMNVLKEQAEKGRLENERLELELKNYKDHPDLLELSQISDSPIKLISYAMSRVFGNTNSAKVIKEYTNKRDSFKNFGDDK